jgi:hypothetical protein
MGLAAHTMGLVAHTIGLAALIVDGLVLIFLVMHNVGDCQYLAVKMAASIKTCYSVLLLPSLLEYCAYHCSLAPSRPSDSKFGQN